MVFSHFDANRLSVVTERPNCNVIKHLALEAAYFGIGLSKLERHDVRYLSPAATKLLMLKLKAKIIHFFVKRTLKIA